MIFPPSVWGPFFWHTIHIVAIGYPKKPTYIDKKCAKEFYESLAYLIPCSVCRTHYKEHITSNPLTPFLDSRTDLIKWTVDRPTNMEREKVSTISNYGRRIRDCNKRYSPKT